MEVNGAVLRGESGRAVRVVAMISDITARKSARTKSFGKPRLKRR